MKLRGAAAYITPLIAAGAMLAALQSECGPQPEVAPKKGLRIVAYNLDWMNEGISFAREGHLRSVVKNLNPDILALEEVQSKRSLRRFLGDEWKICMVDDPKEDQEMAIAYREPLRLIEGPTLLFSGPQFDDAFPARRDLLRAVLQTPGGNRLEIYAVHMKSRGGPGGRRGTDSTRIKAARLLLGEIRKRNATNVAVLGDFNDTPDDVSVTILETGNPGAAGGMVDKTGPYLFDLMAGLNARDFVSQGVRDLYRGVSFEPQIRGAREENDKWRGKDYRFPDDLAIVQALFDQILVSPALVKEQIGEAGIYCGKDAVEGDVSSVHKTSRGATVYESQGSLASDHLPVYADFALK